jgi:hypothetical protein
MDRITKTLLKDFADEHGLTALGESDAFERFSNFSVVSKHYSDSFDVEDLTVGGGNDTGIDGIAIIVNGRLVTSEEEIDDITEQNKYLEASFVFIQAKTSSGFDGAEMGTFGFGVLDFFAENPKLPRNEFITRIAHLQQVIFQKSALMSRGKPQCLMFYVTTGSWQNDSNLVGRIQGIVGDLKNLHLFKDVSFHPIDADGIQRLYQETKGKVAADFVFERKTVLPDIEGVVEAYLGVLPAQEYLRLIMDENDGIRKSLFYDNVRDFQEYNDINKGLRETLQSAKKERFAVLNNGVTIVARSMTTVGNRFRIEDYQIVNGCQTSHVLYDERAALTASLFVPIKLIATEDDTLTNDIIKATNSQTPVKAEDLSALSDFQKKLESFYASFDGKNKLFYERRSKQFNGLPNIEKTRVVTMSSQIRVFASMFLDEPHLASRYYGTLLKLVGGRIFSPDHDPLPYYASAFAQFRLESFFRDGSVESRMRACRYHLLMLVRYIAGGADMPSLTANKMEKYCLRVLDVLWDDTKALQAFQSAVKIIDDTTGGTFDRDTTKTQGFTDSVKKAGPWNGTEA